MNAYTTAAIMYGISAAVNALTKTANAAKMIDGVEVRHTTPDQFTDEAWNEIQSLPHNAQGETISNLASGNKIHKGFRTDLIGRGKELKVLGYGRADVVFDGTIYELKPNNIKSIIKGIKQLHRYNQAFNNKYKLILIVY